MAKSGSKVQQFILRTLVPIACSIAVGYIFFQEQVFDRQTGAFQFVWSAVVASVFYHLLVYLRMRDAILGLVVLLFLTFVTTRSSQLAYILRDILYVAALGLSIYIYFKYYRQSLAHSYGRIAFLLAGIYGIINVLTMELHLAILRGLALESTGGNLVSLAHTGTFYGALIGFGVGLGIALSERFFGSSKGA